MRYAVLCEGVSVQHDLFGVGIVLGNVFDDLAEVFFLEFVGSVLIVCLAAAKEGGHDELVLVRLDRGIWW